MRIAVLVAVIGGTSIMMTPARAHVVEAEIELSVDAQVPAPVVPPPVNAGGTFTFEVLEDLALEYQLTLRNLTDAAVAAHVHAGVAGVAGAPAFVLTQVDGSTFAGETEPLTEADLATMMAGGFYVDVHTGPNFDGELRGQIVVTDDGINRGRCSCRSLSRRDFRGCVARQISMFDKSERKSAEVRALKKAVKRSACGLAKQPRKKPSACCLPINETERNIVTGKLCAPVKTAAQCDKLGGVFLAEAACIPTSPCSPPASPSGAFVE